MNSFDGEYGATMEAVGCYKRGCSELAENRDLPSIFSVILTAGNYLNGGTVRGQADGFDLAILRRLDSVKATPKTSSKESGPAAARMTLLDYVVRCCYGQNRNRRVVLTESMQNVVRCPKRGKLSEIKHRAMGLVHRLKGCQTMIQRLDSTKKDDVRFIEFLSTFIAEKGHQIEALQAAMEDAVKHYAEIITFYDETAHRTLDQSQEFMTILADFAVAFDRKMEQLIQAKANGDAMSKKQNDATKHRKHNLGQKIPGFSQRQKSEGMLMHELKRALNAKHLNT